MPSYGSKNDYQAASYIIKGKFFLGFEVFEGFLFRSFTFGCQFSNQHFFNYGYIHLIF